MTMLLYIMAKCNYIACVIMSGNIYILVLSQKQEFFLSDKLTIIIYFGINVT